MRAAWKKIRYRLEWLALKSVTKFVSLCVRISSKLQLCESRIADNVNKRGGSLGWDLIGATRASENFSLNLRGPTQSNETIL
jgi:hypothetical protein